MEVFIYAVRDAQTEVYGTPIFQLTEGQARRSFEAAITNPGDPMSKNPEDYALFEMGVYDDQDGTLTPLQPRQLYTGLEAVRAVNVRTAQLELLQEQKDKLLNGQSDLPNPPLTPEEIG